MAVEFYSWNGGAGMDYVGRVEDGEIVDGAAVLESILLEDALAADEGVADPLADEEYLVRRYAGPSFVATIPTAADPADEPDPGRAPGGVIYREVGGDRTWKARALHTGAGAGRYIVRQPSSGDADLLLTITETEETVRLVETDE